MSCTEAGKASRAPVENRCPRVLWVACLLLVLAGGGLLPVAAHADTTNYTVRGVLKAVRSEEHQLVIAHEEIPGFMDAMTMPFPVQDSALLTNTVVGERIRFQLHVTATESWVDHIEHLGAPALATGNLSVLPPREVAAEPRSEAAPSVHSNNPLRRFQFTNELGQAVTLEDFRGQAIALTFFFTRCPIPDFCPRLSRNFEEVQRKLSTQANAPTNWHLLSVTFDPTHDTPEVLKAYGAAYHHDPAHWNFLTGPPDKIAELARLCGMKVEADNGLFNHNFRTLIINASNHLQMVFPTSGDLSDAIVQELLKAMRPTNAVTKVDASLSRSTAKK